jgi:hypothetical protein
MSLNEGGRHTREILIRLQISTLARSSFSRPDCLSSEPQGSCGCLKLALVVITTLQICALDKPHLTSCIVRFTGITEQIFSFLVQDAIYGVRNGSWHIVRSTDNGLSRSALRLYCSIARRTNNNKGERPRGEPCFSFQFCLDRFGGHFPRKFSSNQYSKLDLSRVICALSTF